MMNPLLAAELGRMDYEERVKRGELLARFEAGRVKKPGLWARIAVILGNLLISSGQRLQSRHQPARP